jgi:hypothetical protein
MDNTENTEKQKVIPGLRVIYQTGQRNPRLDESPDMFPFRIEMNFSPPQFMEVAFIMLHGGSEEIIIRATSLEAIHKLIDTNDIRTHPRLRYLKITEGDRSNFKLIEEFFGRMGWKPLTEERKS